MADAVPTYVGQVKDFFLTSRFSSIWRGRNTNLSHRFSTVRRADQILSLRHGQINAQGTHEELMQHNGRYAALFRMQARWYG
jgi:ATP-binding cassette subfamily B protein